MAKGVLVAAGYGTRFLPVTRVVPKELLPIVDRPAVAFVVDELVAAGVTELLVITSRRKRTLDDWFDRDVELEGAVGAARASVGLHPGLTVHFVRQDRMGGTGHALRLARSFAGADPVIVAFPDDLLGPPNVSAALLALHARTGAAVLAAQDLSGQDVSSYGVLDVVSDAEGLRVRGLVEKPARGAEPSHLVSLGRYLYTPALFEALEATWAERDPEAQGEFWPIPAMQRLAEGGQLRAVAVTGPRWDTGTPLGYLQAVVDHALAHDSKLAPAFAAWLKDRVALLRP